MKPTSFIVCLLFIFCFFSIDAQERIKYSKVQVYYNSSDTGGRNDIIDMLELDHFQEQHGSIIAEISASSVKKLKTSNIKFDILVDDAAAELHKKNEAFFAARAKGAAPASSARVALEYPGNPVSNIIAVPAAFTVPSTLGGYLSFAQMNAAMDALVAAYPAIASKTSLGKTYENRDIWMIKISDNVATDESSEPEVLYMGLQHAREAITGASMIFLMQYLCEQYSKDARIKNLVDNREFFIIPCFNPDGWEYNRSTDPNGGGDWRKNRRLNSGGTFGVDLNRNWGIDWGNCSAPILGPASSCGTSTKSAETYWGTGAFSEAETQAVRAFAQSHHLVTGFDQHAYGPYYSLPFGRHSLHTMSAKGQDFYTAIPALMGTYNGMRAADSYDALGYEVAGGFKDWMLMGNIGTGTKDTVYAMTGEGAAGGGNQDFDASIANFWAPADEIVNLSRSMCYQNLQLAYAAGSYVDLQDVSDMAVTSASGNFNFSVQRLGLGNDAVTVSLLPLENIAASGSAVTISSLPNYYQTYSGNISYTLFPGLSTGQRIKFVWKVSTGGYSYADTITKFYNPTVLFSDDMETAGAFATNWTSSSNVSDKWAYTSLDAYGGSKSLTESPAGNYTSSTTRTLTYNGYFVLTGSTAAYLSFWARYHAENFRDKVQVQVSTNGTSGWTALRGSTTIEEPGTLDNATINGVPSLTGIHDSWTHEIFNLSAYNGVAKLYLRFLFTSDSDPSSFKFEVDDGFYLDNISVIKSNASFFNLLPFSIQNFNGKLLPAKKIGLSWEAATDENHRYFEVEKSADGKSFYSIGQITGGAPYSFVDNTPSNGNNFYRIVEINAEGKPTYSKAINVVYNVSKLDVVIYPNPVTEALMLRINDNSISAVDIKITDVEGRIVYAANGVQNTGSEIKINTHNYLPQIYLLKIAGKKGEIISIQKFVKQ